MNTKESKHNVPFMTSFFRSLGVSMTSTVFDFSTFGLCLYIFGVHYAASSAIGNICGAIVSFFMGRHWSFKNSDDKLSGQAFRYAITSVSSALINTAFIVLLVKKMGLNELLSKSIVALIVGITFNFFMFRYFVYKPSK